MLYLKSGELRPYHHGSGKNFLFSWTSSIFTWSKEIGNPATLYIQENDVVFIWCWDAEENVDKTINIVKYLECHDVECACSGKIYHSCTPAYTYIQTFIFKNISIFLLFHSFYWMISLLPSLIKHSKIISGILFHKRTNFRNPLTFKNALCIMLTLIDYWDAELKLRMKIMIINKKGS